MSQWEQFKQEIKSDPKAIDRAVKAARELTIRIKCRRAINDLKKSGRRSQWPNPLYDYPGVA